MTAIQKRIFTGTLLAVLAGCFWAISGLMGQEFFAHYHGNALWVTSMRLIIGSVILLGVAAIQRPQHFLDIWRDRRELPTFLAYCAFGIFANNFLYYETIQLANSATATILQYTAPVFILIVLAVIRRRRPRILAVGLVFTAMLGVLLLITDGDVRRLTISPVALATGILTAFSVGVISMAPQRLLARHGALLVTGWGMLTAGVLSNVFYPIWRIDFRLTLASVSYALLIALVGTAIAQLLAMRAIALISPLVFSVATATEPLLAVVLSIPLFGLRFDGLMLLAILLVICSVLWLSKIEGAG